MNRFQMSAEMSLTDSIKLCLANICVDVGKYVTMTAINDKTKTQINNFSNNNTIT